MAFVSLCCDRDMNDAIPTTFPVEMTSSMILSQQIDT